MKRRTYNGEADLVEMQAMVTERTRVMGPCTNLHPGDVAHRIYSGSRRFNLDDVIPVFEDGDGIAGFGIASPKDHWFDAVTRIGIADNARMEIIHDIAEIATTGGRVGTEVIGHDTSLASALSDMGFGPKTSDYVLTQQRLTRPITVPPHDYVLRSASIGDAEQLAAVHAGAFGSTWTPDEYAHRMRQPGYNAEDELVAVDDDGTFMGFTNTWYDDVNMVGYFEPVGVHRDFHRRGIGSVLLAHGMARMRSRGMTTASVMHARAEERAVEFYRSNGFEVHSVVTDWERTPSARSIPVIVQTSSRYNTT